MSVTDAGSAPAHGGIEGGARREYFVAIAHGDAGVATFVPDSQHFVALAARGVTIATKCTLPRRAVRTCGRPGFAQSASGSSE